MHNGETSGKSPTWKVHSGKYLINGNNVVFVIDNKTIKLYYNTKINSEYNKYNIFILLYTVLTPEYFTYYTEERGHVKDRFEF